MHCKNYTVKPLTGGGGQVSVQGAMHMADALAGCKKAYPCPLQKNGEEPGYEARKALAGPFLSFLTQMGVDKAPLPF